MATKHFSHMVVTKRLTRFTFYKQTNITFCLKVVELIRQMQSAKIKQDFVIRKDEKELPLFKNNKVFWQDFIICQR